MPPRYCLTCQRLLSPDEPGACQCDPPEASRRVTLTAQQRDELAVLHELERRVSGWAEAGELPVKTRHLLVKRLVLERKAVVRNVEADADAATSGWLPTLSPQWARDGGEDEALKEALAGVVAAPATSAISSDEDAPAPAPLAPPPERRGRRPMPRHHEAPLPSGEDEEATPSDAEPDAWVEEEPPRPSMWDTLIMPFLRQSWMYLLGTFLVLASGLYLSSMVWSDLSGEGRQIFVAGVLHVIGAVFGGLGRWLDRKLQVRPAARVFALVQVGFLGMGALASGSMLLEQPVMGGVAALVSALHGWWALRALSVEPQGAPWVPAWWAHVVGALALPAVAQAMPSAALPLLTMVFGTLWWSVSTLPLQDAEGRPRAPSPRAWLLGDVESGERPGAVAWLGRVVSLVSLAVPLALVVGWMVGGRLQESGLQVSHVSGWLGVWMALLGNALLDLGGARRAKKGLGGASALGLILAALAPVLGASLGWSMLLRGLLLMRAGWVAWRQLPSRLPDALLAIGALFAWMGLVTGAFGGVIFGQRFWSWMPNLLIALLPGELLVMALAWGLRRHKQRMSAVLGVLSWSSMLLGLLAAACVTERPDATFIVLGALVPAWLAVAIGAHRPRYVTLATLGGLAIHAAILGLPLLEGLRGERAAFVFIALLGGQAVLWWALARGVRRLWLSEPARQSLDHHVLGLVALMLAMLTLDPLWDAPLHVWRPGALALLAYAAFAAVGLCMARLAHETQRHVVAYASVGTLLVGVILGGMALPRALGIPVQPWTPILLILAGCAIGVELTRKLRPPTEAPRLFLFNSRADAPLDASVWLHPTRHAIEALLVIEALMIFNPRVGLLVKAIAGVGAVATLWRLGMIAPNARRAGLVHVVGGMVATVGVAKLAQGLGLGADSAHEAVRYAPLLLGAAFAPMWMSAVTLACARLMPAPPAPSEGDDAEASDTPVDTPIDTPIDTLPSWPAELVSIGRLLVWPALLLASSAATLGALSLAQAPTLWWFGWVGLAPWLLHQAAEAEEGWARPTAVAGAGAWGVLAVGMTLARVMGWLEPLRPELLGVGIGAGVLALSALSATVVRSARLRTTVDMVCAGALALAMPWWWIIALISGFQWLERGGSLTGINALDGMLLWSLWPAAALAVHARMRRGLSVWLAGVVLVVWPAVSVSVLNGLLGVPMALAAPAPLWGLLGLGAAALGVRGLKIERGHARAWVIIFGVLALCLAPPLESAVAIVLGMALTLAAAGLLIAHVPHRARWYTWGVLVAAFAVRELGALVAGLTSPVTHNSLFALGLLGGSLGLAVAASLAARGEASDASADASAAGRDTVVAARWRASDGALLLVSAALGVDMLLHIVRAGDITGAPWTGVELACWTLALLGLAWRFAAQSRRLDAEWPGYLAVASIVALELFLSGPAQLYDERWDAWIVVGLTLGVLGARELIARAGGDALTRALDRCAPLLPAIAVLLAALQNPEWPHGLLLFGAIAYGVAAQSTRRRWLLVPAMICLNAELIILWLDMGVTAPLWYVLPIGLSMFASARLFHKHLHPSARNGLRITGGLLIYASGLFQVLQFTSVLDVIVLAGLCIGGIVAGLLLRVRSFLVLGALFLVLDVLVNLFRIGMQDRLIGMVFLFATGVLFLGGAVASNIWRDRLGDRIKAAREELREWE